MHTGKPQQTGRKIFCHELPPWVDPDASDFFITINCQHRGTNQLSVPPVAEALLASACFYHDQQKWLLHLLLLMPDHLHMVVSFGRQHAMEKLIPAWKRYTARQHGIVWQEGFFEHRLRDIANVEAKADYILQNPVRAGLAAKIGDWPYVIHNAGIQ